MGAQRHPSMNELLDSSLRLTDTYMQNILKCAAYAEGMVFEHYKLLNHVIEIEKKIQQTKEIFISVDDLISVKAFIELDHLICKTCPALRLPSYNHLIKPKILAHAKIEVQLDILEEKAQNLTERNYLPAAAATQQIIIGLHKLNKQFFIKKAINDAEYKVKALETIDKNKAILEEHRDYNYIIANFILAILTVGTAPLIHKVKYGNFLFFSQTDSAQKIAPLRQLITEQNETQIQLLKHR